MRNAKPTNPTPLRTGWNIFYLCGYLKIPLNPPLQKGDFLCFPPYSKLTITHIYPSPPRGICSKLNNRKSMNIEYLPNTISQLKLAPMRPQEEWTYG